MVYSDDGKAYLYKLPTNCIVESKEFQNRSKTQSGGGRMVIISIIIPRLQLIITFLMHITKICTYLCRYIEFIYFSPRHYYFVNLSWICQDHHYIVLQHLSISFSQEMENGWNIWCGAMPTAELHCGKFQTHQNVLACNWKKYVYKLLSV